MTFKSRQSGLGTILVIAIVVVTLALAGVSYTVLHRGGKKTTDGATQTATPATPTPSMAPSSANPVQPIDQYAGWQASTSSRAGFSIKYPSNWKYSEFSGKDNVEHITLVSAHATIKIDSYKGSDPGDGGLTRTTCPDCKSVLASDDINLTGLGAVKLERVSYSLDGGEGKALILRLTDGTYYLPSKKDPSVRTSFRATSNLDSIDAYKGETSSAMASSADYANAGLILKSVSF
jgi:hypothetical protein